MRKHIPLPNPAGVVQIPRGACPIRRGHPMRPVYPAALALLAACFPLVSAHAQNAANEVGTDIGTLYQDETAPLYKAPGYSPYARRNYPTRVLWGDTHLHTANSLDAAAFGNTLGPEVAYRFARGEEVVSSSGQPVKLSRPLDFLVVADHAEGLGSTEELKQGNPTLMADPTLRRWHDLMAAGGENASKAAIEIIRSVGAGTTPKAMLSRQLARLRTETACRPLGWYQQWEIALGHARRSGCEEPERLGPLSL